MPQPFSARNLDAEAITCAATLAHWYSIEFGTAAAGESVTARLWRDPANGAVLLLNEQGDPMPVETLWCGLRGRSWQTRSLIPLHRRQGNSSGSMELECRATAGRLACTEVHR